MWKYIPDYKPSDEILKQINEKVFQSPERSGPKGYKCWFYTECMENERGEIFAKFFNPMTHELHQVNINEFLGKPTIEERVAELEKKIEANVKVMNDFIQSFILKGRPN
jgi:hypothetical protein